MSINTKIKSAYEQYCNPSDRFILAVSGGPDSQCLLKAFPHVIAAPERCLAVGIHHGLRDEAGAELDLAEALAIKAGVQWSRIAIKGLSAHGNVQSKAREARYSNLGWAAQVFGAKYIVTAHHFDDRAETVLIRLLRGENIGSMGVMPYVSDVGDMAGGAKIFRPMLDVKRKEIMSHLARWGVEFATDPSNKNTHYLRARIRHEIMPLLEGINPKFKERLNNISNEILNNV